MLRPAVALVHARPAQLGQPPVGGLVLRARVAVAEVLGEVEPQALRQPAASRSTASGMLAEALGHPLGRGEHVGGVARAAGAPSRRASHPGAPPPSRPGAPRARARGRGRCRWPRTAPRAARPARPSRRLRRRSLRAKGRWSSTRKRSGPKARSSRRATAAAPGWSPASTRPATAPSRAQPERHTSPSALLLDLLERRLLGWSSSGSWPGRRPARTPGAGSVQPSRAQRRVRQWAAVISRQRLVYPCRRLAQEGEVGAVVERQLGSGDRAAPRAARSACAISMAP